MSASRDHVAAGDEAQIFERAPVGYMLLDSGWRILDVNRAWRSSLGYSKHEVLGHCVEEFLAHPDQSLAALAAPDSCPGYLEQVELALRCRDGRTIDVLLNADLEADRVRCIYLDVTEQRQLAAERDRVIAELQRALSEIRTLRGLLPICASCKKIRNESGGWEQLEVYVRDRTEAEFSHGLCPDCVRALYPELTDPERTDDPRHGR